MNVVAPTVTWRSPPAKVVVVPSAATSGPCGSDSVSLSFESSSTVASGNVATGSARSTVVVTSSAPVSLGAGSRPIPCRRVSTSLNETTSAGRSPVTVGYDAPTSAGAGSTADSR